MKILIIESEKQLAHRIHHLLKSKNLDADFAYDGTSAEGYASLGIYDLLILDVSLPDSNGYQLVKKLRTKHYGVPILMLSADQSLEARVAALNVGADYYLKKPFDEKELLACVRALLRRQGKQIDELSFGNTTLNLAAGTLNCKNANVRLSAKEFEVMRLLLQNPERNLGKETILAHVWGYDSEAVENHVEVYIGFLRKKLSEIGSDIKIVTIRKLGYHLEIQNIA